MKPNMKIAALVMALGFVANCAFAAVSADEAAALKTTLTPMGAEKAGNKDGTIPAWTGVYDKVAPGYKPGAARIDPFADEKPVCIHNWQERGSICRQAVGQEQLRC